MREAIIELLSDVKVVAVHTMAGRADDQESAREDCLLRLFQPLNNSAVHVSRLMIESREIQPVNRGQNHRDHKSVIIGRHRGLLRPKMVHGWYPKTEPLGWLADAIAGAVLESLRGSNKMLDLIRHSTDDVVIIETDP